MWLPALQVARQQLATCLDATSHTGASRSRSLLSEGAYTALERSLLQRLSMLSTKTLDAEFSQLRSVGQQLLNALGIEDTEAEFGNTQDRQFIDEHRQDSFRRLFQTYPVLGRLIAVAVDLWVTATAEFIQRLATDHADIQQVFGSAPVGNVAAIQASLSDPHNHGRTVMLLTFESGLKLVYKPKDSGLEVAWNRLLTWCNQQRQQAPYQMPRWQAVNTDNMHLRPETVFLPGEKNVPHLGDCPQSPHDYYPRIVAGFEQMCRFLMQHQSALLAPEGPLAALQHQNVRFILRATRIYFIVLQKAWRPESLKHGADYSIELDYLSRAFVVAQERPDAWPVVSAELPSMEQLDIPFFTANTSRDDLPLTPLQAIPQYFKQPSYRDAVSQIQTLNETNLAQQVAIIQGAFYARVAQPSAVESQSWQADELPLLSAEQLIQAAREIASDLEARALPDRDGSLNWFGMGFVPQAERFQLRVLNDALYDGRTGIALFLAALYQVTDEPHVRDLALRSLQACRQQLHSMTAPARQRMARLMGIGGAAGISSMIYALVKVSQFTGEPALLTDAGILAAQITPDLIEADRTLDLIGGAAGGLLGLLVLYDATGEMAGLDKAIACGQHLIRHQTHPETGPRGWKSIAEKPLTGFSHGAAGIAYALLRLYAATGDTGYREAALEGMAYEQSVFSKEHANWPDLRDIHPKDKPAFVVQWCHGAAGIGLGRLASLLLLKAHASGDELPPDIEQDMDIALRTTQQHPLKMIDHVCCGNLGLSDVLMVGAAHCQRPDWRQVALQKASAVVARAQQAGGYHLFSNLPATVFNPGFFQGTSGIGYQFLRLAREKLPSALLWQ